MLILHGIRLLRQSLVSVHPETPFHRKSPLSHFVEGVETFQGETIYGSFDQFCTFAIHTPPREVPVPLEAYQGNFCERTFINTSYRRSLGNNRK